MKTKEQIQERISKLEKRLDLIARHHDKYVLLYHKVLNSWKDLYSSRAARYRSRYSELYYLWREMVCYKKGLEWTLKSEADNDKQILCVYECMYYRLNMLSQCKYYPKGCSECEYLVKVGKEIDNDR